MAEEVDININIDPNGSVRKQIKETVLAMQKLELQGKATGAQYDALRQKLDTLNDTQDRAKFKAGQFEDRLASLPGPLGKIGSGLKAAGDSFATFGKTLTISLGVIGLLVTAFFSIKSALEKTKEGQQGLSKAVEAFNKVLSPVFAILEKVGNAVLPIVTKGFEALGSVMNKVAKFFGVTDDKIKEVQGTLQQDNEYKKKLDEEESKRLTDLQKKKDDQAQKDKERREKSRQEKEEAEKEAFEEEKRNLEAQLTELERIRKKREKLSTQTILQDSLGLKVEAAKKEEAELEKRKKDSEDRIKYLGINTIEEQTAALKNIGTPALIQELQKQEDAYKASKAAEKKFVELTEEDKLNIIADGIGAVASLVGENTIAGKSLAVAQASIDTYAGANKALAAYPPPFGAIAAGTVIVAGLMNVRKILSTQLPKIPGARGSASQGPAPSMGSVPSIPTPQVQTGQGINATQQIAQTIGASQKPIQAYVVSTQITSQQALDRRTNSAATFS
jgi:hypothetical protein